MVKDRFPEGRGAGGGSVSCHCLRMAVDESGVETIVAISTPPGRGGIGIVRLSGPAARAIAEPLLKLRHPLAPSQARFAEILDSTSENPTLTLDEAVVTYFQSPHSYTSEDI